MGLRLQTPDPRTCWKVVGCERGVEGKRWRKREEGKGNGERRKEKEGERDRGRKWRRGRKKLDEQGMKLGEEGLWDGERKGG